MKNDAAKKALYDKLVEKVNNIDTSEIVLKTKYQTDKSELEKNSWYSGLVKKQITIIKSVKKKRKF